MTDSKQTGRHRPWRLPLLLVGAVGLSAWVYWSGPTTLPEEEKRPPKIVKTVIPEPKDARITVSAYGSVVPARRVVIEPQVSGHLVRLNARLIPGGRVGRGEELYAIDPELAELNVREAAAEVSRGEADLTEAQRKRAEGERLAAESVIPMTELAALESEVRIRAAELERLRVREARSEELLLRHVVHAPFNALVLEESVEIGQRVDPGNPTAVLVGTDEFWVQVALPTDKLPWVRLPSATDGGAAAEVWLDAGGGAAVGYSGRVVQLLADMEEEGRMARVLIEVKDPLGLAGTGGTLPLLLGSYVRVEIEAGTLRGVLVIDRSALREGDRIWVVDGQNRLQIREVTVRWRQGEEVYLDAGLQPGEQLVVSGLRVALPGSEVEPQLVAEVPGTGPTAALSRP